MRAPECVRRAVGRYVDHYNTVRLHSAIGYVAPADKLAARETDIFEQRDRKLAEARERRAIRRQAINQATPAGESPARQRETCILVAPCV